MKLLRISNKDVVTNGTDNGKECCALHLGPCLLVFWSLCMRALATLALPDYPSHPQIGGPVARGRNLCPRCLPISTRKLNCRIPVINALHLGPCLLHISLCYPNYNGHFFSINCKIGFSISQTNKATSVETSADAHWKELEILSPSYSFMKKDPTLDDDFFFLNQTTAPALFPLGS